MVSAKKNGKKVFFTPCHPPFKIMAVSKIFGQNQMYIFLNTWYGYDQILGLLKSFAFLMWCICGACFKNRLTRPIKGYFAHTGCPKNPKLPYFGAKMEIHRYDQNIWSPEMFFLYDVVDLSWLISKMDRQR